RNLEDVGDVAGGRALLRQMHVGENGQPGGRSNPIERGESLVQSRSTMRAGVRAIGFVEAGLIDDATWNALGQLREMFGDRQIQRVILEDARAGDQKEGVTAKVRRHVSRRPPPTILESTSG